MSHQGAERPRWIPSPLLLASAALHAGAGLGVLLRPGVWPWALGTVVTNHLLLGAAGLLPRSHLLGPNWTRLPAHSAERGEVAITIDDGPDPEVTPQVLSQLARHRARASFFCVGERVERYPELVRQIVQAATRWKTTANATATPSPSSDHAPCGRRLPDAQDEIARVTGNAPCFFRAPAGLRNPFLDPVLSRLQLRLASWTRRGFDTVTRDADAVYARLVKSLQAGDILLLHDGNAARGKNGVPVILDVLPRLLETLSDAEIAADHAAGGAAMSMARKLAGWGERAVPGGGALCLPFCTRQIDPRSGIRGLVGTWASDAPRRRSGSRLRPGTARRVAARRPRRLGLRRVARSLAAASATVRVRGIELAGPPTRRAQRALGSRAEFVAGDVRRVDFGSADVIVILDVLHYMAYADQRAILERAHGALSRPWACAAARRRCGRRRGFALGKSVDRLVLLAARSRHRSPLLPHRGRMAHIAVGDGIRQRDPADEPRHSFCQRADRCEADDEPAAAHGIHGGQLHRARSRADTRFAARGNAAG